MTAMPAKDSLVKRALAGERRAIAQLMSLAESGPDRGREELSEIYKHTGKAHVIGLTGVPGSGKSTMVRALARNLRDLGHKVGIVAIDPSSPFSGGAILGDRLRMTGLTGDDGVFIRSMATRGALGGLAAASLDVVDILDAAGFDKILIETVGVGQDEVDIVQAAHTVIVVSAPGLGDDVQAIKAGVLEIADIHVVSKCDRHDAPKTVAELKAMQGLGAGVKKTRWQVPVQPTSAQTGEGIADLVQATADHLDHLKDTGEMDGRRKRILEMRVLKAAEDLVRTRLIKERDGRLNDLMTQMLDRRLSPHGAARDLLKVFGIGCDE